jgi:hypothetical protein
MTVTLVTRSKGLCVVRGHMSGSWVGLSQATVKTHLHGLRKTDTNRQSDLVKLVAGLGAPGPQLHG